MAAAVASIGGGGTRLWAANGGWGDQPIAVFEKVFEGLSYDELAEAMEAIGAAGPEATIRPGGHIEPAQAAEEVPKMSAALKARGRRIVIAATHVRRVDEPHGESLLRVLKAEGVRYYRMGHYRFDPDRPLRRQVADFAVQARDLAAMNASLGIQGLYQNHAGARYLGALGWDAAEMLEGIDPDHLGMALDLRHLRADTGSAWKTVVRLLKPHIRSIYIKDGKWTGPRSNKLQNVPVDTGFVDDGLFEFVRKGLSPMVLCLHMEHMGYRVFEKHEIPGAVEAHRNDIAAIRRWLD